MEIMKNIGRELRLRRLLTKAGDQVDGLRAVDESFGVRKLKDCRLFKEVVEVFEDNVNGEFIADGLVMSRTSGYWELTSSRRCGHVEANMNGSELVVVNFSHSVSKRYRINEGLIQGYSLGVTNTLGGDKGLVMCLYYLQEHEDRLFVDEIARRWIGKKK